jgi:hypothetical protein
LKSNHGERLERGKQKEKRESRKLLEFVVDVIIDLGLPIIEEIK